MPDVPRPSWRPLFLASLIAQCVLADSGIAPPPPSPWALLTAFCSLQEPPFAACLSSRWAMRSMRLHKRVQSERSP